MDQKSWLWRRKSLEKTITGNDAVRMPSREAEIKTYSTKKSTNLKKSMEMLNEKLLSTITESNAKDELVKQHAKVAEEAIAGWEKAEAEAVGLKRELETAIRLKEAAEDKVHHLDSTLKECMLQLRHSREEHDRKILEASMKAAREYDKMRADFEDKLVEKNKVICEIDFTNNQLLSTIQMKEKLIDNLDSHKCRIEAELNELLGRLDSTEKENSSLKYEVFMIQKELEIRHEDRDFSQKAADASHKQHLNDVKKIAKLETECQRLRLLVQKRLPGPAALAKMKLEVEALGREKTESRRKLPPSVTSQPENVNDKRRIAFLTEQLSVLEEEKVLLMDNLKQKDTELQALRYTRAQTLSTVEHFKVENEVPGKMRFLSSGTASSDFSLMPISRDAKNSSVDSRASTLILEDKNSKSERSQSPTCTSIGVSDLSLMDDFAEMEKLALVSVEVAKDTYRKDYSTVLTGREIVPFEDCRKDTIQKSDSCIEDVLMLILQHSRATRKSYETSLEEVRNALVKIGSTGHDEVTASSTAEVPSLLKPNDEKINSNICRSVQKITNLIEGIGKHEISPGCKSSSAYTVRMFQWKSSELCDILHRFLQKCNDLIKEKVSYEMFFIELASTLEWVMNHCFSLQDVSSMKASIKKSCEWDDTHSESEAEEFKDIFPLSEKISQFKLLEENILLKGEISKIDSRKKLLEDKLQSTENMMETLRLHVQESDKNIANLQKELALANKSEEEIENQQKSQNFLHGCLDTEEVIANEKLNDTHSKFQCSEVKLEDKNLQQQVESVHKNGSSNVEAEPARMKWDISMASEKLAECQETILNLGKQLKAMSSPSNAIVLNKAAKATSPVRGNKHSSLLEQILGEDDAKDELSSPKTKEIICSTACSKDCKNPNNPNSGLLYGSKLLRKGDKMEKSISKKRDSWEKCNTANGLTPLAIIPVRPKSRGFFVRLFMRRRRGSSKRAFPGIPTR